MNVVADTLTAGAPDQTAHVTVQIWVLLSLKELSPFCIKKKLHVFIFKSLMGRQVLKQTGNSGMDTDNKRMQVRNKTKQAVLWAARTGDNTEITCTRWRCTLSTSFSGSVGATVTVMSEPPLNIPAQVNISTKIWSVTFKGSALVWNSSLQMGQSSSHQDREL